MGIPSRGHLLPGGRTKRRREEDTTAKPNTTKSNATSPNTGANATPEPTSDFDDRGPDSIDDLEDLEGLDGIDDGELDDDELDDTVLDDEDDGDGIDGLDDDDEGVDDVVVDVVTPARATKLAESPDAAADTETDDDDLQAEEVEASLDVILAERLRGDVGDIDEPLDDDDDDEDDDAPNQLATIIPVRQPDEFLCQSCFLLKPPGQLADADHQLCRDCA